MTHRERRCAHCSIRYSYQASGEGCGDPLNDGRYCPDCKAVINEALKSVPKAVERFSVVVDMVERQDILTLRDMIDAALPPEFDPANPFAFMRPRQIKAGLYDLESGATMGIRVIHRDGVEYDIATWSDKREPESVTRYMERDLKTGVEVPWRRIER